MLAGLIQSPEVARPVTHPDRAARRRASVLDAMVEHAQDHADEARRGATQEPLPTHTSIPTGQRNYYIDAS